MRSKFVSATAMWRLAAVTFVAVAAGSAIGAHTVGAQSITVDSALQELHSSVPAMGAEATMAHPLSGSTLSLAGTLTLGGDDMSPTIWVKAVEESGRVTMYTTPQLESLGYQVKMPSPNHVVLLYGPVRLVVSNPGAM